MFVSMTFRRRILVGIFTVLLLLKGFKSCYLCCFECWALDSCYLNVGLFDSKSILSMSVQCKSSPHCFAVCPANTSRANDLGKCSAFVDYAQPTFGDNCAGVQAFRSSPFQSKVYPVGSWADQWLALDSSFNTASCTTGVSVVDAEPPSISKLADLVLDMAVLCPCTYLDT